MDDDDKEPKDAAAEPAGDATQDEGAKLRVVPGADLKQILAAHETWLETGGTEGERADLSRTDLRKVDLRQANLQEANLRRANFRGANLRKANLQEADLRGAVLQRANLRKANLRDADLSDAKLSDVIGLLADRLAGANLSNAKLSEDIAAFDGLDRVEEISRIGRPIFIGILAGCVYSWLTIATTTDARLLTNSASSPLPIIGTEIPIAGFYWVAPILLLGVYLYLHLYLQRLWEGLADLPAVFPDGKPLNKEVYPWLLSGLVRAHFKLLKDERTLLSRLENGATIFLAWWIVPVTVLLFWGRYLPRHEWIGTGLHVVLLVVSIGSAILLHRHAAATLRRDVTAFDWRRPWRDRRAYQGAVALGLGVVFALVSLGAIEREGRRGVGAKPVILKGITTWVPYAFERMGYRTYANLQEADLSTKPATWTGLAERPPEELDKLDKSLVEKAKAELGQVKGARLERTDLRHALAPGAFLAKADLGRANLQGAVLLSANLQKANLIGANLQGASLYFANLQGAELSNANLQGAELRRVNFKGVNLTHAEPQGANLSFANLQKAKLRSAILRGADFSFANLQGTDLAEAKGLTREQLDEACGDDGTTLPNYLADYQMKPCPTPPQPPSK